MTHDQGRGDNRRSSLGPFYRCNVDYEAQNMAQCALAKRSYAVEGYRRLVSLVPRLYGGKVKPSITCMSMRVIAPTFRRDRILSGRRARPYNADVNGVQATGTLVPRPIV